MQQFDLAGLKEDLNSGKMDLWELANFVMSKADEDGGDLIEQMLSDSGITADKAIAVQWAPLFIQNWMNDQTLDYTIHNYKYPAGIPDLTKDRTNDYEIMNDGSTIRHIEYNECVDLDYDVVTGTATYKFGRRYLVTPEKQVLKFD